MRSPKCAASSRGLAWPSVKSLQSGAKLPYNPANSPMRGVAVRATHSQAVTERRICIITAESSSFPDMQHFLAPTFAASLSQTEEQIEHALNDPKVRAVLIDMD